MENIDYIRRFKEYKNLPEDFDKSLYNSYNDIQLNDCKEEDEVLGLIFAPDPQTGVPRSDLALMLSRDTAPEIAQYIRDTLMRTQGQSSSVGDDPDLALKLTKFRKETLFEYGTRLREFVQNESKSESK